MDGNTSEQVRLGKYYSLLGAGGLGSLLGSGIIVSLSATITVWQDGLNLTELQVGIISAALTIAIGLGSIVGGRAADVIGRVRVFEWVNFLYAIGALICVFSNGFTMLTIGVIIAGVASGTDLPVSLAVISNDSPDEKTQAKLVSLTQVFWQVGIMASYLCAFVTAWMGGITGARVVFAVIALIAAVCWVWRAFTPGIRKLHREAELRIANEHRTLADKDEHVSITSLLFGEQRGTYLPVFLGILVFYCGWNLLANTWGQFQTFMLVKAHASQAFATGFGFISQIIGLGLGVLFAAVAASKYRSKAFVTGGLLQAGAVAFMALGGGSLVFLVIGILVYGFGGMFAGEAMYKVWTQESFPHEARASVQGLINGISRFVCALFAVITPTLVLPENIRNTMWLFCGIALISLLAGCAVMSSQKRAGVGYRTAPAEVKQ